MTADGSTEYFQGRVRFFVLGDFLFFLKKMCNIEFSYRISNCFFPHLGRGT